MSKKQLQWAAIGAAILLLALVIAILTNRETPETVIETHETPKQNIVEEPEEAEETKEEPEKDSEMVPEDDASVTEEADDPQPEVPVADPPASSPDPAPVKPSPNKTEEQKQPVAAPAGPIEEGTYIVGTDIEPGEYLVFSNGITLLENSKDASGDSDSIIFNVALDGRSHAYVTVLEGEYFTLTGGEMYPVASAPSVKPANGIFKDGQYKVGTDIAPGTYTLKVEDQSDIGFYEISKNSRQDMMDLLVSDVVEGETSVTVTDGQYLTIRNAYLETP